MTKKKRKVLVGWIEPDLAALKTMKWAVERELEYIRLLDKFASYQKEQI